MSIIIIPLYGPFKLSTLTNTIYVADSTGCPLVTITLARPDTIVIYPNPAPLPVPPIPLPVPAPIAKKKPKAITKIPFITKIPMVEYITSDICFIKGTLLSTDQGDFPIETIKKQTIKRKPIIITKTIHYDPYLVKVSAYAFGEFPTMDTYMSLKHHIILDKPIMARELINHKTITQVPYDGEPLYNVLMGTHTSMWVHGMLVETLDPNSIVGLFYRAKLSPKIKTEMIKMINEEPEKARTILKTL